MQLKNSLLVLVLNSISLLGLFQDSEKGCEEENCGEAAQAEQRGSQGKATDQDNMPPQQRVERLADKRLARDFAEIARLSAELHAQCARRRRLRPAGVRAGVIAAVAEENAPGISSAAACQRGG